MIRVIGGDFKKNGIVKLIKRKGEIAALELPVGIMKTELYAPEHIRTLDEELDLGRSIVLNVSFSDGRYALLRASKHEAEEIISLGVALKRATSEPKNKQANILTSAPQKSRKQSPASAIALLILLLVTVPPVLALFVEEHGYGPALFAGVIIVVYVICLWRPQPIPFGKARWKSAAMVCIFALGAFYVHMQIDVQKELATLRKSDPVAYLEKLKALGEEEKWLEELEQFDPETYRREMAHIERRKAQKQEEERLAAQKRAEEQRQIAEQEKCGEYQTAYVYATILVRPLLKNPDGAEFIRTGRRVNMVECGKWKVQSTFDGTNSFGATIRTHYTVIVRRVAKDHWVLEDINTW
tara:strand:- start:2939 stop:4000 length:1062 start_codon:yes stop_codon:yes gene_type:complete